MLYTRMVNHLNTYSLILTFVLLFYFERFHYQYFLYTFYIWKLNLLSCVPYVLMCQHALNAYVLTCWRALRAYVLTCQRVLGVYVLTPFVLRVLTCQLALRALRAIITNNKDKFSITCFPDIFVIVLCFLPVK